MFGKHRLASEIYKATCLAPRRAPAEDFLKLVHDGHHRCQHVECGRSTTDGVWERSGSTMVSDDDEEANGDRQAKRQKGGGREKKKRERLEAYKEE